MIVIQVKWVNHLKSCLYLFISNLKNNGYALRILLRYQKCSVRMIYYKHYVQCCWMIWNVHSWWTVNNKFTISRFSWRPSKETTKRRSSSWARNRSKSSSWRPSWTARIVSVRRWRKRFVSMKEFIVYPQKFHRILDYNLNNDGINIDHWITWWLGRIWEPFLMAEIGKCAIYYYILSCLWTNFLDENFELVIV